MRVVLHLTYALYPFLALHALLALHGCSWDWDRYEPRPGKVTVCGGSDAIGREDLPPGVLAIPYCHRSVDGLAAERGSLSSVAEQLQVGDPVSSAADLAARFDLAWDEERLYVAIEVDDNLIDFTERQFAFDRDGVEVLVNSLGDAPCDGGSGATALCSDDHHLMISASGVLALGHAAASPSVGDIALGFEEATDGRGYHLELGLDWDYLRQRDGATVLPGQSIGFDLAVIDRDGDATARRVVMWRSADSYQVDTSGWGPATLVCDGEQALLSGR